MIAIIVALPVLSVGAQGNSADDTSPAEDHAEVIAQGIGAIPSGEIAWRLVEADAAAVEDAEGVERALGFTVAADEALLVTDQTSGGRVRLGAGEATFVAGGATQTVARLGDGDGTYWRIGLVPADAASDAGDGTLVFGSDAFEVTGDDRERDLDLVAAKLADGESTTVDSEFPVLVVVTDGKATVGRDGGDESTEIEAGEATLVDGAVELTATDDETRVLVAVIGEAVPAATIDDSTADDDAEATPVEGDDDATDDEAGTSRIIALSKACPIGVTVDEASDPSAADPCFESGPVSGMTVTAINAETGDSYSDTVTTDAGAYLGDLPAGSYSVFFEGGDGYGETFGVCGGQDQSADLPVITFGENAVDLELPADREYLCVTKTITLGDDGGDAGDDDEAATTGSIGATFYACPDGMTFETLDASQCSVITDGFDFGVQGSEELHLSDAGVSGGGFVWHGLPVDDDVSWSLAAFTYPDGYEWYAFSVDGGEIMEPHAGGLLLTSDQPIRMIQVYFLPVLV